MAADDALQLADHAAPKRSAQPTRESCMLGLVGLETTLDEDSRLDFRCSNPTDGYVLIQSTTDESNVYFELYSQWREWTVRVDEPILTNRVPPNIHVMTR